LKKANVVCRDPLWLRHAVFLEKLIVTDLVKKFHVGRDPLRLRHAVFLEKLIVTDLVKNSTPFIGPENSLPYLLIPHIELYA
jgi:hypothetical protein